MSAHRPQPKHASFSAAARLRSLRVSEASSSRDSTGAQAVLARLHAYVNAHDADGIASLCHADVAWHDPAAPEPLLGRDAVRRFHRDTMFRALPDVRVAMIDGPYLTIDHSAVAVRLRISGTMRGALDPPGFAPTDGPIEFETAEFSAIESGLLVRHTVVLNMLGLARQIGAIPRAGSFAERVGIWLQHFSAHRARGRR